MSKIIFLYSFYSYFLQILAYRYIILFINSITSIIISSCIQHIKQYNLILYMGNSSSEIGLFNQQITDIQSIYDTHFGRIKIFKIKHSPFKYYMSYQEPIIKDSIPQQVKKYTNLIKKLKEIQIPNIAQIIWYSCRQNNHIICNVDEIGRIQIFQEYYTYTIKDYVKSFLNMNKCIQEKNIWYVAETLIKLYMALNQNRIECRFESSKLFLTLGGDIVIYPNFFMNPNKKILGKSDYFFKSINQKKQKIKINSFKTQLLKILFYVIFLQQKYQNFVDQVDNYSQIQFLKFKKLIQTTNYSLKLKKLIIELGSQYTVNWPKIIQRYFINPTEQIAKFIQITNFIEQWKNMQTHYGKKKKIQNITFPFTPRPKSNFTQSFKFNQNIFFKNKSQSQQQTDGNLNSSLNYTSSNSIQMIKNQQNLKISKISLTKLNFSGRKNSD